MILRGEITELKPLTYLDRMEILGIGALVKGGFQNPADDFLREAINLSEVLMPNIDSTYYGYACGFFLYRLLFVNAKKTNFLYGV